MLKQNRLLWAKKMKVQLIEQEKNIEIQEKQAELTEKELNAQSVKAEADKYVVEQNALADKARNCSCPSRGWKGGN